MTAGAREPMTSIVVAKSARMDADNARCVLLLRLPASMKSAAGTRNDASTLGVALNPTGASSRYRAK